MKMRVWFAGADSLGGDHFFATEDVWREFVTVGEGAQVIRSFLRSGYIDVSETNLVAVLNGDLAGAIAVEPPAKNPAPSHDQSTGYGGFRSDHF